jgi:hypothetical protein
MRKVGRVHCFVRPFVAFLLQHIEIFGVLRVSLASNFWVAVQQGTRVVWTEQPFVRVDNKAVALFNTVK